MTTGQARKILGIEARQMSDAEIDKVLSDFYILGEIVLDVIDKNGSNNHTRVIDSDVVKEHDNDN